jgi:hypothetical protein
MKELEQFLTDRAMEHDSPTLLFTLAQEYLISAKTIRPGVTILAKMVATARTSRQGGHIHRKRSRSSRQRPSQRRCTEPQRR